MNIEAIADRLATAGLGINGKTLFATEMPTSCKKGILLMHPYYGTPIDHELPGYFVTEFRLVVRDTDYPAGEALAKAASAALTIKLDGTVGTMLVKKMLPQNLPRPYRRSAGGYWEFQVEVEVVYVDQAA